MKSGQKLADRYQLTDLLGQGGIGEVWRAVDLNLDRPVAVKVFLGSLAGTAGPVPTSTHVPPLDPL